MITVYQLDAQGVFTAAIEIDPMGPLPVPLAMTAPPATVGDEVARWNGNAWDVLADRPALPPGPTPEQLRAQIKPISPLQGILTLGETEWGKVLAYRETASWAEKIIIDNANDWVRTSQTIAFFGYLLEYTDDEMDTLFIAAAQVRA